MFPTTPTLVEGAMSSDGAAGSGVAGPVAGDALSEWPFPHVRCARAPAGMRALVLLDDEGHAIGRVELPASVMDEMAEAERLQQHRDRLIPRLTLIK